MRREEAQVVAQNQQYLEDLARQAVDASFAAGENRTYNIVTAEVTERLNNNAGILS